MAIRGLDSKAGGAADDEAEAIVAEINITPLVDIFLVLLIIFMVTSSVMSQLGVDVTLPSSERVASTSDEPEGVIVTLLPGGQLKLNGQRIESDALETALKSLFSRIKGRTVILEGDEQAMLGAAVRVMDEAKRAGAERFSIATRSGS